MPSRHSILVTGPIFAVWCSLSHYRADVAALRWGETDDSDRQEQAYNDSNK
jgi:hypothetical protein